MKTETLENHIAELARTVQPSPGAERAVHALIKAGIIADNANTFVRAAEVVQTAAFDDIAEGLELIPLRCRRMATFAEAAVRFTERPDRLAKQLAEGESEGRHVDH
jgi:hypothetical protein|tara:strand:+ start:322 stop:639 length:318 start_codon:yes stop_codon:yes gene_type:complete